MLLADLDRLANDSRSAQTFERQPTVRFQDQFDGLGDKPRRNLQPARAVSSSCDSHWGF
jgi:hypothetical protein